MPIINFNDRRTFGGRILVLSMYALLTLGGLAMVYPFLGMVTGSVSNHFDYERRATFPRFLWSEEDRFLRYLCANFPPMYRSSFPQLRSYFTDWPEEWNTWAQLSNEKDRVHGSARQLTDAWARRQLADTKDPERLRQMGVAAGDYAEFMQGWDLGETVSVLIHVDRFFEDRYGTIQKFNQAWECAVEDLYTAPTSEWSGEPFDQPSYIPDKKETRYRDLIAFREVCRQNRYTPYLKGAAAGYIRPAAIRHLWNDFAKKDLFSGESPQREVLRASRVEELPFPVPSDAPPLLVATWQRFLKESFPLRHIEIPVTADMEVAFQRFLKDRFQRVDYFNGLMESRIADWSEVKLSSTMPGMPLSTVWMDFIRQQVPVAEWRVRDTLPEKAFQDFVRRKYGSVEAVNNAYGLKLGRVEQLTIPFREALLTTFAERGWKITAALASEPYGAVISSLGRQTRTWTNTLILVCLAMLLTITVNPLAGYALSRFRLRHSEKVIIFCLGTMAFPVAVSAIPGFLLLRDLGMLNTFAALVLPSAANGMTIFILKGFFDSLPKELYEAATIDGAPEWRIFLHVALPLMKPILAVNLLGAFLGAYNAWEWAMVVCQGREMWTIAVWTMQFAGAGAYGMAVFVVTSIPVLVVFLLCQKVILRGIILPQMK